MQDLRAASGGEVVASAESGQVAGRAPEEQLTGWVRVADLADLPPGSALEVRRNGRVYALFRIGDSVRGLDGLCPHQGGTWRPPAGQSRS
jgi:Rieske [2Fe-2S] domain